MAEHLSGAAKTEYDIARLLYAKGEYAGARIKFSEAYALSKDPRLLWNMAACEGKLQHYAKMHSLIKSYLSEGGMPAANEQRGAAERAMQALERLASPLSVEVSEPGAVVTVDGETVGTSPISEPVFVDLGTRQVRITKPGFKDYVTSVNSTGGQEIRMSAVLKRASDQGRIIVTVSNGGAILVDGKPVGDATWEGSLQAGRHTLRVTAPGSKPYEAEFMLRESESRRFQISLEPEKEKFPWLLAGAGAAAVAGAVVGGYFLFRPGDGPIGTMGKVEVPLQVFGGR